MCFIVPCFEMSYCKPKVMITQCGHWPLWFISSLDSCGAVPLGCSLMPVSIWRRVGMSHKGVLRLLPISVWGTRPCWFHISYNPSVVNLVIVPLTLTKTVIGMTFHLLEIQLNGLRTHTPLQTLYIQESHLYTRNKHGQISRDTLSALFIRMPSSTEMFGWYFHTR